MKGRCNNRTMLIARFRDIHGWQNTYTGDDYPSAGAGRRRAGLSACGPSEGVSEGGCRAAELATFDLICMLPPHLTSHFMGEDYYAR